MKIAQKPNIHSLLFFLDDFHQGAVNHLMHFIGFTLLGYGLGILNIWIIIFSPLVMEVGHFCNYATGRHREVAIKIIPMQIVAGAIFVGIGYFLAIFFV